MVSKTPSVIPNIRLSFEKVSVWISIVLWVVTIVSDDFCDDMRLRGTPP
jgi:hypothetical protein